MSIDDTIEVIKGPGFVQIRNLRTNEYACVEVDAAGNFSRATGAGYLLRKLNEDYGILGVVANLKKDLNPRKKQ